MDAHIMAGSYHNYISPEQLDYFYSLQRIQNVPASPAPSAELHPQQPTYIQMFNNLTQMYESLPLATACQMFRAEGRERVTRFGGICIKFAKYGHSRLKAATGTSRTFWRLA